VDEGVLIVPSHMGERPIRAMHGYHPSEPHSYAVICTNQPTLPEEVQAIPDIFKLMAREVAALKAAQRPQSGRRSATA
ncbi:nucleotide pyrophosphatase, partial [bacterium]|nr:nucleotide pyrophosphatase [bacterium]